jgi:hypothetical protein
MAETLEQRSQELFQNYNNFSNETAQEFVSYVFSLIPGSGGIIHGNLEITGNLTVDTDFVLDGVVKDTFGIISADFNNRQFYDGSANLLIDYGAGELYRPSGSLSANWGNVLTTFGIDDTNLNKSFAAKNQSLDDLFAIYNGGKVLLGDNSISNPADAPNVLDLGGAYMSNYSVAALKLKYTSDGIGVGVHYTGSGQAELWTNLQTSLVDYGIYMTPTERLFYISNGSGSLGIYNFTRHVNSAMDGIPLILNALDSNNAETPYAFIEAEIQDNTAGAQSGNFNINTYNAGVLLKAFTIGMDGSIYTNGNKGASGSFTSADAKTVTVTNGIITSIV